MGQVFEQVHSVGDMALLSEAELVAFLVDAFRYCGYVVKDMPDEEDYGASFVMSKIDRKIAVRAAQDAGKTGLDVVKEAHFAKDFYKTDEAWVVSPHGFTAQAASAAKDTGVRLVEGEVVLQLLELYAVDAIGPAPDATDTQDKLHTPAVSDESLLAHPHDAAKYIRSVVVPEGVEEIERGAFARYTNLQSLTLPSTLKRIGFEAFKGCSALREVELPNSLLHIGFAAFEGCTSLASIRIPPRVESIGGWAFKGCTGLGSVTLPASLREIDRSAFAGCSSLREIRIPEQIEVIKAEAFSGCSLLSDVTFPDSLTTIEGQASKVHVARKGRFALVYRGGHALRLRRVQQPVGGHHPGRGMPRHVLPQQLCGLPKTGHSHFPAKPPQHSEVGKRRSVSRDV